MGEPSGRTSKGERGEAGKEEIYACRKKKGTRRTFGAINIHNNPVVQTVGLGAFKTQLKVSLI